MSKDAKDKKFFSLKKASSDAKINKAANGEEVMSPSEDALSENVKKKKGFDFSRFGKKKKEKKQQMDENLSQVKEKGKKVKKDIEKAKTDVQEDVKDTVKQKKESNLKFGIFGLRSKIYLCFLVPIVFMIVVGIVSYRYASKPPDGKLDYRRLPHALWPCCLRGKRARYHLWLHPHEKRRRFILFGLFI